MTSRVTHQLLSRIFAIFLREVLFYENVNLIERPKFPEENEHDRLFLSLMPLSLRAVWPEPTVDLEVWMLPDYHVIPDQVRDAGAVTNAGRFGWFIPKKFINITHPITYRHFQANGDTAEKSTFHLDDDELKKILPMAE